MVSRVRRVQGERGQRTLRSVTCACVLSLLSAACGSQSSTDHETTQQANANDSTIADDDAALSTGSVGNLRQTDAAVEPPAEAGVDENASTMDREPTGIPTDECSPAKSEQACLSLSDTLLDGNCRWLQLETVQVNGDTCETLSSEPACIFFGGNQRGGCGSQCASGAPHFRVRGDDSLLLRNQRIGCDVPGNSERWGWEECDDTNPIGACLCACDRLTR